MASPDRGDCGRRKISFHFNVQGSVAKSTHAGIPWLRHLRQRRPHLHFWPFDGWDPAPGASVITEVYPKPWSGLYDSGDRTPDQHGAFAVASWMRDASRRGIVGDCLKAPMPESVAATAQVEGWILGTTWPPVKLKRSAREGRKRPPMAKTQPGFTNRNNQHVITGTDIPGTDHNQVVYILSCLSRGQRYGANGSDIFQRRCPTCGQGRPGLPIE